MPHLLPLTASLVALLVNSAVLAEDGAGHCVKGYMPRTTAEAEIVRVENEWCDAAIRRDAARLNAIFASDLTWIEDTGYRDKSQVLHRYMVEVQERLIELRDIRISVIGDLGVVSAHVHVRKITAGRYEESDHTATDVFVRRAGRWQLLIE